MKPSQAIKRYGNAYKALDKQSNILVARFAFIVGSIETTLSQQLQKTFNRVYGMDSASIQYHIDQTISDTSKLIHRVLENPLKKPDETLWGIDDIATIRKAIAFLVLKSSSLAWALSDIIAGDKIDKSILDDSRMIMQSALARRVANYAAAFDAAIKDWVFVNVQHPINIGHDPAIVLPASVRELVETSPFRVGGLTPQERIKQISKGEMALGFFGTIAAISAVAKQDNPDSTLIARSVAIHDDKTADDSLEAEAITAGWVEYPDPYFDATDFRRRPNDRCMDVVIRQEDLESGNEDKAQEVIID